MRTRGIVKEVLTDHVVVECERRTACVSCEFAANCAEKCEKTLARATDALGAEVGDEVEIESETKPFLIGALLFFIAPIALLAAAYFLFSAFAGKAISAILSVALALADIILTGTFLNKKAGEKIPGRVVRIITLKNESEIDIGK